MPLSKSIKKAKQESAKSKTPIWAGPCGEGAQGGISQSLISDYLCCRERFRIKTVEGIAAQGCFDDSLEFGQMWHIAEECHAANQDWEGSLTEYCKMLCKQYPLNRTDVDHWYGIVRVEFPLYVRHWQHHPDVKERTPILQEQVFDVPYPLPSKRVVRLRGKWDSVDLIGKGIYLAENKTKGRILPKEIQQRLNFDLQTCLYLISLQRWIDLGETPLSKDAACAPVNGVRYNVVRRPAQYQGKKETRVDFLRRLSGIISDSPAEFFMRWKVEISPQDIERFRRECLDPVLENVCDDYEWWVWCREQDESVYNYQLRQEQFSDSPSQSAHIARHYRLPYGIWNNILEGRGTELDDYIATGSMTGLTHVESLFGELE